MTMPPACPICVHRTSMGHGRLKAASTKMPDYGKYLNCIPGGKTRFEIIIMQMKKIGKKILVFWAFDGRSLSEFRIWRAYYFGCKLLRR